jgi:hypothetical protein
LFNTSNTISLKYDNAKLSVDASGNLTVKNGGTSQWTTTGPSIFYKGGSSGYSQPLVRIEQATAWNGNYAPQAVGYSDIGEIRINGADT